MFRSTTVISEPSPELS